MLKTILALLLLSCCTFAQQKPAPVTKAPPLPPKLIEESLRSENDSLKAQLAQIRLEFQYQMQVCQAPDIMRIRLAAIDAQKKMDDTKPKADTQPSPKP